MIHHVMQDYNPKDIEKKWQQVWEKDGIYTTQENSDKKNFYILDMFPYPSGEGLHVGHPRGYIATDVYSRFKRMHGFNVLHPMGWDAFGLPAENFAIKNKVHPREAVDRNVARFKEQLSLIGPDYDWSREIDTTDPNFYKWTQWMFLKMYEKGLAYQSHEPINWCPGCQTGLANEDLESDGTCERCGSVVEKKPMRQWVLKITDYADRLLSDLDTLPKWPEGVKEAQRNWIGKSEGVEVSFTLQVKNETTKVLIIHGFEGDPSEGWKPWLKESLENLGYEVRSPKMPNFANPEYNEVMDFLEEQTKDFGENDIVVGHSLGGHFAIKIAERKKLKKVVIVAPTIGGFEMSYKTWKENDPDSDFDACENILEKHKVNFDQIKADSKVAIFGEADQGIPIEHADLLDSSWHVIRKPNTGHMSSEKEVPEILQAILPSVKVFTTRPDTLFGATYMVLAPEHPLIKTLAIENHDEVNAYIAQVAEKTEIDRTAEGKEKTGVKLQGIVAINPANKEEIPVYIADYVLAHYGTGAVMAVPAHDQRDFAFAKKFDLPIKDVVIPDIVDSKNPHQENWPVVEKNNVHAVVYNPKDDTYLTLAWKNYDWKTIVLGGIEDNEDAVEAARREVYEETGYKNLVFKKHLGAPIRSQYAASHKKQNRIAYSTGVYFELENEERDTVAQEEQDLFSVVWMPAKEFTPQNITNVELEIWLQRIAGLDNAYTDYGVLVNSGEFNGLASQEAKQKITEFVGGEMKSTYRLKDWVFSRQRYWGEPIPMVFGADGNVYPVDASELPILLPNVDSYEPTGTGESPLATIDDWVNVRGKITDKGTFIQDANGEMFRRETNTMPQWAGSSWYYLRYVDPKNNHSAIDSTKEKDWLPVDVYVGGDHATRHLIYARFWHKFLYDIDVVSGLEPFPRLEFLGFIQAEDGRKMSKRWGNIVNPDDMVDRFGADAFRLYEMFIGPFENTVPWSTDGLVGTRRFLEKIWRQQEKIQDMPNEKLNVVLHKTIKKVSTDIEAFKFNTAVSQMMILANELDKEQTIGKDQYQVVLQLLAPFAPHMAEELWQKAVAADEKSIHISTWPVYDESQAIESEMTLAVQVNGKTRSMLVVLVQTSEDDIKKLAQEDEKIKKYLTSQPKKIIYVPGRLVSIVV